MQFDDLYHKHVIYSQGEDLFGLPKTEEPELLRVRKELNLLQKLYGLYNSVNTIIDGYNELSWSEVDCEKINAELTELQNRFVHILISMSAEFTLIVLDRMSSQHEISINKHFKQLLSKLFFSSIAF